MVLEGVEKREGRVIWNDELEEKCCYLYFFFQAEDGIRDAQESRGLGDVYKRQVGRQPQLLTANFYLLTSNLMIDNIHILNGPNLNPVSYTHLTLPTIYPV